MACFSLDEMEGLSERQGRSVGVPDMEVSIRGTRLNLDHPCICPRTVSSRSTFPPCIYLFFSLGSFSFHVVVLFFIFFYGVQKHVL